MADSQSPTPSGGNQEGTDLRSIAGQIEGLLDDDGQFNQTGESRALNPEKFESDRPRDESGKFKAAEQTDEVQESVQESEPEMDEAARDLADEDTRQGDTDEQVADSAVEEPESDEAETGTIRSMAELAEALEMSVDDFKESLTHKFRASNEDVEVTLAELEKGYQRDADYRKGTSENAETKRQLESDYHSRLQGLELQHQYLAAHLNATEEVIAAKLQSPQLEQLRQSDPAEWNALQTEIGQELALVRQRREEAARQYTNFQQQGLVETKQRELSALQQARPDFTEKHADKAREAMKSLGFDQGEISQIMDHRLVLGAVELNELRAEVHQLRSEKERAKQTVKTVKQDIPTLQKPGKHRAARGQAAIQRDNVKKLKENLAKSNRLEDAALVIEQMI